MQFLLMKCNPHFTYAIGTMSIIKIDTYKFQMCHSSN
jgi:hypothetical protein